MIFAGDFQEFLQIGSKAVRILGSGAVWEQILVALPDMLTPLRVRPENTQEIIFGAAY